MRLVIIESPFKGETSAQEAVHVSYARRALRDSLDRLEAPLASHLLYTQVLDDTVLEERVRGIAAGMVWAPHAECVAVYTDYGVSEGMRQALAWHQEHGHPIEIRTIGINP